MFWHSSRSMGFSDLSVRSVFGRLQGVIYAKVNVS